MPRVRDLSPRRSRTVIADGPAFWRGTTRPFSTELSSLKFPSLNDSYRSVAHASNRFVTVTDVSDIQRILYGSGFDRGNDYESSFLAEVVALVQMDGSPAPGYFGPADIGHRTPALIESAYKMGSYATGPAASLDGTRSLMMRILQNSLDQSSEALDPRVRQVSDSTLKVFGATALAQTYPLKPPASLLTALAELISDGLPPILGKTLFTKGPGRAGLIASVGGEYLNYLFGYKPIVDEIFTTLSTIKLMDVYLQQWKRNVGSETRRAFAAKTSPLTWTVNSVQEGYSFSSKPNLNVVAHGPGDTFGTGISTRFAGAPGAIPGNWGRRGAHGSGKYTRDMRFTGCYWYNAEAIRDLNIPEPFASYMANGDKRAFIDALHKAKILGLGEGLAQVSWQLLPWSWMIDWFVNIGDIISNANVTIDNNVQLRYGYVTSREVWEEDLTSYYSASEGRIGTFVSAKRVRMRRIRATPYGFGTTFEGLTDSKKAILAALAAAFFDGRQK